MSIFPVKTPNISILEAECYAIHEFNSSSDAYRETATFMSLCKQAKGSVA